MTWDIDPYASASDVNKEISINIPQVVSEVKESVLRYEHALTSNIIDILDESFWMSPCTVRYGTTECLYGHDQISAFRKSRPGKHLDRKIRRLEITTFGVDFAVANIEFSREGEPRTGRQSQTWVRFAEGWRVVAAHVSQCDSPGSK